jgi:TIR domain
MHSELGVNRARIYVSFADEDRPRAMQLVRWLNDSGWRVTADDRHSFGAGERWSPTPRLEFCDVILCVITPRWLASDLCRHEYSYCAKRGRFVLPVIFELLDVGLLPPALRVLPRVDLTQGRMIDYLALKQVLTQTGSQIARAAAGEADRSRRGVLAWMAGRRRYFWPALAAVALATVALIGLGAWLWTLR